MPDILFISRWFYPAGISLLIWITGCAVLAVIIVLAAWLFRGGWQKHLSRTAAVLGSAGALVCLGMILVETLVLEFASPLCVISYAALAAVFAWLILQSRSGHPRKVQLAASFLVASTAFTYLFPFGGIPPVVELEPGDLAGLEGTNVLGGGSGTLLVAEFADFQCPPCAVQDRTMDELWAAYPDQIRYSFRHLPLKNIHPHAEAAALESQCAADFGKFWETKRLLFANQHRLGEILGGVLPTIAPSEARKYRECVESRSAWSDVQKDLRQAERLGLRRTPSTVIGNKLIVGIVSYPRLEAIMRHELRARSLELQEAKQILTPACGLPLSRGSCAE